MTLPALVIQRMAADGRMTELIDFYPEYAENGTYQTAERETEKWMADHVEAEWWCLDVGAHVGYYTILLSRLAHRGYVVGVEASPHTAAKLRHNVWHNLQLSEAEEWPMLGPTLLQMAVGATQGVADETLWLTGTATEQGRTSGRYTFTTIDALCQHWTRVDLIKTDVDGWDLEALRGAALTVQRHRPFIVSEVNHALGWRGHSMQDVLDLIGPWGYDHLVLDGGNPNNWLLFPKEIEL